jgi:hypothetical protein
MSLVICRTCKAQIAANARVCPQCGARKTSLPTKVVAGFIGLGITLAFIPKPDSQKNDGVPVAAPDVDLSKTVQPPPAVVPARTLTPPLGFRGHSWGSSPTKEMKAIGIPTDDADKAQVWVRRSPSEPFLGIPVSQEVAMYTRGRLYGGQVYVSGSNNFERLRTALAADYGRPSFSNPVNQVYVWTWNNSQVKVQLYRSGDTATVDFENKAI